MSIKNKTLIILDWDDTLFPTSWTTKNDIDLTDLDTQNKYIISFSKLDLLLHKLLTNFLNCGTVIIVTNATLGWVLISSNILPSTQELIKSNIRVISARDHYQEKLPDKSSSWKKLIFERLALNSQKNKNFKNIISVGDADYEFYALVNLSKYQTRNSKALKSIRFMKGPTFESLVKQLEILNDKVEDICYQNKHLDLEFSEV